MATINLENDRLASAFDDADIAYTRVKDELGWEWIEWACDATDVDYRTVGESPWMSVIFDIDNDAAVAVISEILGARS